MAVVAEARDALEDRRARQPFPSQELEDHAEERPVVVVQRLAENEPQEDLLAFDAAHVDAVDSWPILDLA
jgi:hypothetical protein